MDNQMIFDEKEKRRRGIINFIPATAFFITLLYYIYLLLPLTHGHPEPGSAVGITADNYNTLFMMLAVSAVISAGILIYNMITLAKLRNMNTQTKLIWTLLLVTFVPIAFILFWIFVIKNEPKYVDVYPNMA